MNIHIVPDEKFIDTFIEIAEAVSKPNTNIFLVRSNAPFKYIKSTNVVEAPVDSAAFNEAIAKATPNDLVHIHYLSSEMCRWLQTTDCKARFSWLFWGSEFYEVSGITFGLYEPMTAQYVSKTKINTERLSKYLVLHQYRKWKLGRKIKAIQKEKRDTMGAAVGKLSYIMHYNRLDYDLICKHFPTKAQFQYFNYPPPHTFEQINEGVKHTPNPLAVASRDLNCWLGNSGYANNNHIDYFSQLAKMGINNLKLWTPLNYGDEAYIKDMLQYGQEILGDKFQPITEYMTFDSFMKAIHSMDVSIMPHKRPQAFGNIQLLLYFGKKVFMDDNTLYQFLIDQGYHIYSVTEMSNTSLKTPLSEAEKQHNHRLMGEQFSKNVSIQHIAKCLQL